MCRPDVVAIVQAANAAVQPVKADAVTAVTGVDPRIADLMGKGLTEDEAVRLIASIW